MISYFVSFTAKDPDLEATIYGNGIVKRDKPVTSFSDIIEMKEYFQENGGIEEVIILFWKRMEE